MKNFWQIFFLTILIFTAEYSNISAQSEDDEEFFLKEALAQLKKKEPPFSLEARFNENELIFRYKRFFIDYNRVDSKNNLGYLKLKVDNEIISLLGTGIDWSYGVTGISWKDFDENNFVPVPTLGLDFYIKVMPKVKVYTQFSGMPVGGFGRIYDAETGLHYSPDKRFTITGGYRHLTTKINHKSSYGGFKRSGFFIGCRADF